MVVQGRQFLSPRCVVGSKAECYSPGHTAEIWGKEMRRSPPLAFSGDMSVLQSPFLQAALAL